VRRPICLAEICESAQGLAKSQLVWGGEDVRGWENARTMIHKLRFGD
jgi:hypothetical protein